jgi:16S rRNA (guanine(966)-N(2))-methyltransferase RsmD
VRPTTDKIRLAIFSILGDKVMGSNVLDLFAGTGSIGIEALSRGAAKCTFVDINIKMIIENTKFIPKEDKIIKKADVFKIINKLTDKFDLIFIDPPYGQHKISDFFEKIEKTILEDDGIIIYEESIKTEIKDDLNFECFDIRKYGDTNISFWRKKL